jgi:hypothetical protein
MQLHVNISTFVACSLWDPILQISIAVVIFRRVRKIAKSFVMSVRLSALHNSASTGWILMKFDIWVFFEILSRKLNFHKNRISITGTLHEDRYTFLIISLPFLLRMSNVSDKRRRNQNTHFTSINIFFFENPTVCEIMWKNIVERGRTQVTIWRMRIACSITKATNTHSEYVILIGLPLQQWLHERASMLRYTYISCLVFVLIFMYF